MQCSERICCNSISLRSSPLEVVGSRKNGRARGKRERETREGRGSAYAEGLRKWFNAFGECGYFQLV